MKASGICSQSVLSPFFHDLAINPFTLFVCHISMVFISLTMVQILGLGHPDSIIWSYDFVIYFTIFSKVCVTRDLKLFLPDIGFIDSH